jgi:glycosyltransferase involved in cell wall biosynthesis
VSLETAASAVGEEATRTGPLRIALYAGIVVQRDAVSWSLLHKLETLRRLIALGAPLEPTVFAQSIDDPGPEFVLCPTVGKLLGRREFWDADLHIFEEGMYYELFESVHLIPPEKPILAIEHNSTPTALVEVPSMRAAVERSHIQRRNLLRATHVACVSELNVEMARAAGVPDDRLSVLHLPPAIVPTGAVSPLRPHEGPVRLLYLGRFVRAKGIADILTVADRLIAQENGRFHVTLAGDPRFSDPALMDAMREAAERAPDAIDVVWAPDDRAAAELLARCDALVIPSYHEGYCVPVVEAYGFGRYVIAYDAGNLPTILGGLGSIVPTGDVDALEAEIRRFADAITGGAPLPAVLGPLTMTKWADLVRRHLADYSAAHFERGFLATLFDLLNQPSDASVAVRRAIDTRFGQLEGVE